MSSYEYVGDTPILLAGVVLGDGVSIQRADGDEVQEEGQSPFLYPHDHLILPDDHEVVHAALIDAAGHHAGEHIEHIKTPRAKAAEKTEE